MNESEQDDRGRPARSPATDRDATPRQVTGTTDGWDMEFAAFYREWTKPLVGFLVVQGAGVALAADLVQTTMATLYRRWPEVGHPRAWAYVTASRALVRAMSTVRETPTDDPEPQPSPLLRTGATNIELWEQRHDLIERIRRLPSRQRQVMAWTLHEHTPAEIAERLGLSREAVRSNLYQARNTLKAWLAGQEDDR